MLSSVVLEQRTIPLIQLDGFLSRWSSRCAYEFIVEATRVVIKSTVMGPSEQIITAKILSFFMIVKTNNTLGLITGEGAFLTNQIVSLEAKES